MENSCSRSFTFKLEQLFLFFSSRNVEDIDVEEVTQAPTLHFDVAKARTLMNECERHASFARPDDQQEDWEEKLSKWDAEYSF